MTWTFSNAIFRTVVQQLTRFQRTGASRGPSVTSEPLGNEVTVRIHMETHAHSRPTAITRSDL